MNDSALVTWRKLDSGVAVITLNNPPLNLNTLVSLGQLLDVCRSISVDEEVRAVVVTGAGEKAFCAGSDVSEFAAVRDDVVAKKLAKENAAFTAIEELPQPVIAALNGATLGGGAEIALACDIRIADEDIQIGFPEVKLGVFAGSGGVFRLPRVVGLGVAYELLYTGNSITAQRAERVGLVNRTAPSGRALEYALELADELSRRSAPALSVVKTSVRESFHQSVAEATRQALDSSELLFAGRDLDEGVMAFFEKRSPQFSARRHQP